MITELYANFEENEFSKVFDNDEFKYKEYAVNQPLQRNCAITEDRIEKMLNGGALSGLYAQDKMDENMLLAPILAKEQKVLDKYMEEEVLPHVPYAAWFFEEKVHAKKPIIKTGAEFPFTRYFYEYRIPEKAEDLLSEFMDIEENRTRKFLFFYRRYSFAILRRIYKIHCCFIQNDRRCS